MSGPIAGPYSARTYVLFFFLKIPYRFLLVYLYLGVHISRPVVGRVQHEIFVLVVRVSPDRAVVSPLEGEGALRSAIRPLRRSEVPVQRMFGSVIYRRGKGEGGGVVLILIHGGSPITIDPRTSTMRGRSTSGFHRPGRHFLAPSTKRRGEER